MKQKISLLLIATLFLGLGALGENGYRLWLRFDQIEDELVRTRYQQQIQQIHFEGNSPILSTAERELRHGLSALLGKELNAGAEDLQQPGIVVGITGNSTILDQLLSLEDK
ncbi:MAG: hypothetical protein OEM26_15950, partial [Saprospiraceae bacterium]|nr:hypothetical protein [Saprospiraceae bacterium]